jgi:hypothetical protein
LDDIQEANLFRRDSMQQLSKIDSLEQASKASLKYGHESMVSLASIASSIADIERRLSWVRVSSAHDMTRESPQNLRASHSTGSLNVSRTEIRPQTRFTFTLGTSSGSDCSVSSDGHAGPVPSSGIIDRRDLHEADDWKANAVLFEEPAMIEEAIEACDKERETNFDNPKEAAKFSSVGNSESSMSSVNDGTVMLLAAAELTYPPKVAAYISKSQLIQNIEQQIRLLSLQTHDNEDVQKHLTLLSQQLEVMKCSQNKVREKCLKLGHSLHSIDEILSSCKIHDPITGLRLPNNNLTARHADLLALRKRSLKSSFMSADPVYTRRDRINKWLFKNLQNSPENAALHRSMMVGGTESELDEKTWARLVVKYWSIDQAATGDEYYTVNVSTNEAAHSYAPTTDFQDRSQAQSFDKPQSVKFTAPKMLERSVHNKVEALTKVTTDHFPIRRFERSRETKLCLVDVMTRLAFKPE